MKIKRFLSVLLTVFLAVGAFALPASAINRDISRDVTLTIYALETANGSDVTVDTAVTGEKVTITDKEPIAGISYFLYRVRDNETSTNIPEDVAPVLTEKTGADGSVAVTIPADEQGRYLVVENESPGYTQGSAVPFLVDLPMTNPEGTGYMYDVYVYPKQLVNGAVKLVKTFDGKAPQNGQTAVFTLVDANGEMTDYTTDPSSGLLTINDLPFGKYKLYEKSAPDGYIVSEKEFNFTVDKGGCIMSLPDSSSSSDVGTVVDLGTVDNKKAVNPPVPKVSKKVSGDGGKTFGEEANIHSFSGDKAVWKITGEIPSNIKDYDVYEIGDVLDNRLIAPKSDDIKVSINGVELAKNIYSVTVSGNTIKVAFDAANLENYAQKNVDIVFPTAINTEAKNSIGVRIENAATLTYTNVRGTDTDTDTPSTNTITTEKVNVWTGEIKGYKHNKDNNPLAGAEFTIYSDKNCKNVVGKAVSDSKGNFSFKGLKDATYYLKETKAPQGFQADDKVLEVKVSIALNGSVVEIDALNVPKTNLPLTGGAGTLGITLFGVIAVVFGVFMIFKAVKIYKSNRKAQLSM